MRGGSSAWAVDRLGGRKTSRYICTPSLMMGSGGDSSATPRRSAAGVERVFGDVVTPRAAISTAQLPAWQMIATLARAEAAGALGYVFGRKYVRGFKNEYSTG